MTAGSFCGSDPTQGSRPLVTVAIPSFNHAKYIEQAIRSVLSQGIPVELFVFDGGSTDGTRAVIKQYASALAGWRSGPDGGQAEAINQAIAEGTAPYVCWINSDDWLLEGALRTLIRCLEEAPTAPFVYGRVWNRSEESGRQSPVWTRAWSMRAMSRRCLVSQPGTLIRRSAWEAVGGLDESLTMALDYDLWLRLASRFGPPVQCSQFVAVNRDHALTKTNLARAKHYQEAIDVVARHYGRVPWRWYLLQPYSVWYRTFANRFRRLRASR